MTADPTRLRALLAAYGPLKLHEQRDYAGMASLSRDIDPPPVMTMGRIVPGVGEFIVEAVNALPDLLDRLERAEAALKRLPGMLRLRLTGEQMAELPEGTNTEDFFVDFDEYEEWLPWSLVEAVLALAASEPPAPKINPLSNFNDDENDRMPWQD